jgi:PEP-CTERM motif
MSYALKSSFVILTALTSYSAHALTVDGTLDAAYGAAKSTVAYDDAAPTGNFGTPGPTNHLAAYSIYMIADAGKVYGFIQSDRVTGAPFANLYFDIDPLNGNGSDLGFEITNDRAFVPGQSGYSSTLAGLDYALSGDGLSIEFSIENDLFMMPISGLTYWPGQQFPVLGGDIVLRLSQSFGYSVAGGATYGNDRLGRVTLSAGAVPEPATWAMMIAGFGLVGAGMRRRATKVAVRFA